MKMTPLSSVSLPPVTTMRPKEKPTLTSSSFGRPLFFDVETEPVRHDVRLPRPVVGSFSYENDLPRIGSPDEIAALVRAHSGPLVGHNVSFDLAVLGIEHEALGSEARLYDTAIRATLRGAISGDPAAADSSLKRLAGNLGIALSGKGTVQLSFRVGAQLTDEQLQYAKEDITATRAVWQSQGADCRVPDEERQTLLAASVFRMAREGVRIEVARVRGHIAKLERGKSALQSELKSYGIIQPRGSKKDPWKKSAVSEEIIQEFLRKAGATKYTETGEQLAADEEALLATGISELRRLVEYRKISKQITMFQAFDTGEGDVVRAYWKSLVVTGRISCSKPNLTNIPKQGGFRECLLPDEGEVWIDADFPALELRTWAYVCQKWLGRSSLLQTWREGKDPHWRTAATILRTPYDSVKAHPRADETRQLAKVLNFGLPGGMYPKRLRNHLRSKGYPVGLYAATKLRNDWLKTYPEANEYFEYIDGLAEGDRFRVALPDNGRERLCFQNDARNYPFQGLGSDVAKEALKLAQNAGLKVKALVHDQMLVSAPLREAQEVGRVLVQCMQRAGENICPTVPWEGIKFAIYPERWVSKAY